jgi:hypothetical protein
MIAMFFMGSVILGSACGWYGYRACVRIQTWGEKMNDLDNIARLDTYLLDPYIEEYPETQLSFGPSSRAAATLLGGQHLPIA